MVFQFRAVEKVVMNEQITALNNQDCLEMLSNRLTDIFESE